MKIMVQNHPGQKARPYPNNNNNNKKDWWGGSSRRMPAYHT
jgi:hypothetical protein